MKELEITNAVENNLTDEKKAEIKSVINARWEDYYTKAELAKSIEHDYIFGEIANNEHYLISDILALIDEVDLEKNPLPVVEEVVEEVLEEVVEELPVEEINL